MSETGKYVGHLPALHRLLAYPAPTFDKRNPTRSGPRRVRRGAGARTMSQPAVAIAQL